MPEDAVKPALRAALRMHEIGTASPYRLFFAGKGKSGASFGFMQGDLAAGQPFVRETFGLVLTDAHVPASVISSLLNRLSVHLISNPLTPGETKLVSDSLLAGRKRVDVMDESILQEVYGDLDTCSATAFGAGHEIDASGLIYIALWINMSGRPTKLLTWLRGGDPGLAQPVPQPAGGRFNGAALETYLRATSYFQENPGNFPHLRGSAAAGLKLLPNGALLLASGTLEVVFASGTTTSPPSLPIDHFLFEQATGRIYLVEKGARDLFATGYSGSEQEGGKNDPAKQCVQDIGPLPRGVYTIGQPRNEPTPITLPLQPSPANEMCGRSAFLIHGDSIAHPGTASKGCIILARSERKEIASSGVDQLLVVERLV